MTLALLSMLAFMAFARPHIERDEGLSDDVKIQIIYKNGTVQYNPNRGSGSNIFQVPVVVIHHKDRQEKYLHRVRILSTPSGTVSEKGESITLDDEKSSTPDETNATDGRNSTLSVSKNTTDDTTQRTQLPDGENRTLPYGDNITNGTHSEPNNTLKATGSEDVESSTPKSSKPSGTYSKWKTTQNHIQNRKIHLDLKIVRPPSNWPSNIREMNGRPATKAKPSRPRIVRTNARVRTTPIPSGALAPSSPWWLNFFGDFLSYLLGESNNKIRRHYMTGNE